MTELTAWQPTQPTPAVVADYQSRAVQRLGEWAHSAEAAFVIAERLVQSSFVPAAFKGKPIEAASAILAGSEIGLSPMAALRSFDIIQGQAAPRAITLRAVVQSFGHEVNLVESTSTRCVMRGKRRGSSEWQQVQWTIDRAKDLGLTGKDGWKKQPTAMLMARATSELCRLIAADAILGIGYTTEELNDGSVGDPWDAPEAPGEAAKPAAATRTMSRRRAPEPAPPADEIEDAVVEPEQDAQPKMTKRTQGQLFALFAERGWDADTQRAWLSEGLGREVKSRSTVTEDEAQTAIAVLRGEADARGES